MRTLIAVFVLLALAGPAAAQTPTPTQAIIPAGGVQHVWTVDDVTGTTCVTSINERGTSGIDMIAVDQINCGAKTGGTPVPDGGASLRVRNTPNDFYEAPTPVPTISIPYTVLTLVQSTCTGGACSPQFMRNEPLMSVNAGDKFRSGGSEILVASYPGMSVNAWTLMSVTVNGVSSRHRIFQPAIGWTTENESVSSNVFAGAVESPNSTFRWFANQAGNSGLVDGNWAATVVMKVDNADDADIATVEQWLIDEYMITPTPTLTGTPTPTPTPTNTPTATPTLPIGITCVNIPFQTYGSLAFSASENGWTGADVTALSTCDSGADYAQGGASTVGAYSHLLRGSNLDLTGIPTDKSWNGFTVTIEAASVLAANHNDYVVQWINGSSTLAGTNKATSTTYTTGYVTYTYGADYDTWGNTFCITTPGAACPNPAHINLADTDVGIGLSTTRLNSTTSAMRVSCMTIEGCYVDNTPTPTNTAPVGDTPTPTATPTPTPTLDPPAVGCCRSEVYTIP